MWIMSITTLNQILNMFCLCVCVCILFTWFIAEILCMWEIQNVRTQWSRCLENEQLISRHFISTFKFIVCIGNEPNSIYVHVFVWHKLCQCMWEHKSYLKNYMHTHTQIVSRRSYVTHSNEMSLVWKIVCNLPSFRRILL